MSERRQKVSAKGTDNQAERTAPRGRASRPRTAETLIGLYYPYWVFRDQNWLKLAALYWDKLARIAPAGMDPIMLGDRESAEALRDELGFIVNIPFGPEVHRIGPAFVGLVDKHEARLAEHFRMTPAHMRAFKRGGGSRRGLPFEPVYLWEGEMTPDLVDQLVGAQFAAPVAPAPGFLAMHPKLAVVYKQALAEEMAVARQMSPVTDDTLFHVGAAGWSAERLAHGLLDDSEFADASPSEDEVVQEIAMISLRTVVPREIENVPIERIIRLRKDHAGELRVFQEYLRRLVDESRTLLQITDHEARIAHLEVLYGKTLGLQLNELRRLFRFAGIDMVMGAMNVRLALPPAIGAMAHYVGGGFESVVAAAGAAILSIAPVIRTIRKSTAKQVRSSPAAYLLSVQEGLRPSTVTSRVKHKWQQFLGR